jgi:hypothetical protein
LATPFTYAKVNNIAIQNFPLLTIVFYCNKTLFLNRKMGKFGELCFSTVNSTFKKLIWGKTKNLQFFNITKWEINLFILNY